MTQKSNGILIAAILICGFLLFGGGLAVGLYAAGAFEPSPQAAEIPRTESPAVKAQPPAVKPVAVENSKPIPAVERPVITEAAKPIPSKIDEEDQSRQSEIKKWDAEVRRLTDEISDVEAELRLAEKQSVKTFCIQRRFDDHDDKGVYECIDYSAYQTCAVIGDPEIMKTGLPGLKVRLNVKSLGERRTIFKARNEFRNWEEEAYIKYYEVVPALDKEKLKTELDARTAELKTARFNQEHPERAFLSKRWRSLETESTDALQKIEAASVNLDLAIPSIQSKTELVDVWRKFQASIQKFATATDSSRLILSGTMKRIDEFIGAAKGNEDMKQKAVSMKAILETKFALFGRRTDDEIEGLVHEYMDAVGELPDAPATSADLIRCIKKYAAVSQNRKEPFELPFNQAFEEWLKGNLRTVVTQKLRDYIRQIDSLTEQNDDVADIKSKPGIDGYLAGMEAQAGICVKALRELKPLIAELEPVIRDLAAAATDAPRVLAEIESCQKDADESLSIINEHSQDADASVFASHRALLNSMPEKLDTVANVIAATRAIRKSKADAPQLWKTRTVESAYFSWLRVSLGAVVDSDKTQPTDLRTLTAFLNSPDSDYLNADNRRRIENAIKTREEREEAARQKEMKRQALFEDAMKIQSQLARFIAELPPEYDLSIKNTITQLSAALRAKANEMLPLLKQKLSSMDEKQGQETVSKLNDALDKFYDEQSQGLLIKFDESMKQIAERKRLPQLRELTRKLDEVNEQLKELGAPPVIGPMVALQRISSARNSMAAFTRFHIVIAKTKTGDQLKVEAVETAGGKQ